MRLPKMIRILLFSNQPYRFLLLASLIILNGIFIKRSSLLNNSTKKSANFRAVITTLVRSDNRSIYLVMNMIHSVLRYHPYPNTINSSNQSYPFLIFHDQNFTSLMRQQILSCVLNTYPLANISFALVDFNTAVKLSRSSPQAKPIGYRLMCRFWIYDIFYHPAIVQGQYDYLMRMDDDSYFFDRVPHDLFQDMHHTNLDYMFRALYNEPTQIMDMILNRYVDDLLVRIKRCIYNNFFIIRLQWYYQTKSIQAFLHDLLKDDLILREYIGDGCVHGAMLKLDRKASRRQIVTIAYGHNYHVLQMLQRSWKFYPKQNFVREINETCLRLALISSNGKFSSRLLSILLVIYLINWFILFQIRPFPIYEARIDTFLTSTLCGQLISSSNFTLTNEELLELNSQASLYFSTVKGCDLFSHQIAVSTDELSYPLAFTILVHSNLQQFEFLLRTIYRPYNHYCIHVDSKSPLSFYQSIVLRSKCVRNIYVLEDRLNVSWGRFTVLEAEHRCQQELLKQSNQWKYYFNLANSDVPLKTNWELVQILKLYNNQNDVTSLLYRSQLRQNNFRVNRTLPSSIKLPLYKGEFHVLLTRQTVEYIHQNSRVADLYDYLNGTMVPDEHYYSIINRWQTTPGFYPYDHDLSQINFMTRYKIWSDRPESILCRGGFVRGICVFNYADLWHLATSPHFFANKIFFDRDRITPYCLSEYLHLRDNMKYEQRDFSIIDEEFYRQLKNVQFGRRKENKKETG